MASVRVQRFLDLGPLPLSTSRAFVRCLEPWERAEALPLTLGWHYRVREELARAFREDAERRREPCHDDALQRLLVELRTADARTRRAAAYALYLVFDACSSLVRQEVISAFLAARSTHVRNRGFRLLNADWDPALEQKVREMWTQTPSLALATLIINHFPAEFLDAQREDLIYYTAHRSPFARLMWRLLDAGYPVDDLRRINPVTYLYVCAKSGRSASDDDIRDALSFARETPDVFGLAIWSLGRLRRWQELEAIHSEFFGEEYIRPEHLLPSRLTRAGTQGMKQLDL